MTNFDGLPLNTEDALGNIKDLLIAAGVALNSTSEDIKNVGLSIIELATDYSIASHNVDAKPKCLTHELNSCRRQHLTHPTTEAIGARIQLARENLGMSEADLARQLNTYSDHISDWECGITEPPASMIIPLVNALKCNLMWLLTGDATHQSPATPDHQSRCQHLGPLRSDASDHASHHAMNQSQA